MTGDGGDNTYVFTALPWNAGQITNFNPSTDKIDVHAMLSAAGYTGSNPFGDGTLTLTSDGHGGTDLMYNPPGAGANGIWPTLVVDIDHVAPSALNVANDFITSATGASSSSTGAGGTASTGGSTGSTATGTGSSTGSSGSSTSGTGSRRSRMTRGRRSGSGSR